MLLWADAKDHKMPGGPMHKLELEISLDKAQKQHARISSPGKFPSVPSPFSFSSVCKGMGRNWSKQLKSCCNLGFYVNRSEVDIQGWYSISPMMCDIPRGKQWTLELAKEDPEHDRVGSWDGLCSADGSTPDFQFCYMTQSSRIGKKIWAVLHEYYKEKKNESNSSCH